MFKAFKYEYNNIEWEYNDEHFKTWTEGKTGFPIGEHLPSPRFPLLAPFPKLLF